MGLYANTKLYPKNSWSTFQNKMMGLANAKVSGRVNDSVVAKLGLHYLKELEINSAEFKAAVNDSYETANNYWLWQRMIKQQYINGGILSIEDKQIIPLHDHPGATGMMRILSGKAEVWMFDEVKNNDSAAQENIVELKLVSHRTLIAGDTAVLTTEKGNIHALKAVTKECRMLDFFIPPYNRSKRHWFEPTDKNWFNKNTINCKKIPQHVYNKA